MTFYISSLKLSICRHYFSLHACMCLQLYAVFFFKKLYAVFGIKDFRNGNVNKCLKIFIKNFKIKIFNENYNKFIYILQIQYVCRSISILDNPE